MKRLIEIDEDLQMALNEYFEGKRAYVGLDNGVKLLEAVKNGKEIKDDISLIHTAGLDEGIRCAMCTNSIKSDRGCDGNCVVNDKMYQKVTDVIYNNLIEEVGK